MNLLSELTQEHPIHENVLGCFFLYIVLLTKVEDYEGTLYSTYTTKTLRRKFPHIKVDKEIQELKSRGLIEIEKDDNDVEWIIVGEMDGDEIVFLSKSDREYVDRYYYGLMDAINNWKPSARMRGWKSKAAAFIESLKNLKFKTHNEYKTLWDVTYAAMFQEEPREFLAKEHGQLKTFYKLYHHEVVFSLIVEYLSNFEAYGKGHPSIGHLLVMRDVVFQKVTNKKPIGIKTKEHMRVRKNSEF